jgi:hypothetical protein
MARPSQPGNGSQGATEALQGEPQGQQLLMGNERIDDDAENAFVRTIRFMSEEIQRDPKLSEVLLGLPLRHACS